MSAGVNGGREHAGEAGSSPPSVAMEPSRAESPFEAQGLILANDRDRKGLEYLRRSFGDTAVSRAIESIAGARKAYVSNVAKVLGVRIPDEVLYTSREDGLIRIREILKQLPHKRKA